MTEESSGLAHFLFCTRGNEAKTVCITATKIWSKQTQKQSGCTKYDAAD